MSKKYLARHRYSKGVQQEMEDIDYWNQLSPEEKAWMEQFMYESYGNGFYHIPENERILKTEEELQEARRNNNNTNRDVFLRARKLPGQIVSSDTLDHKLVKDEEYEDWEQVYKHGGYEAAVFYLAELTATELNMEFEKKDAKILCDFYFRMRKLTRMIKKDRSIKFKTCEVCKERKPRAQFRPDKRTIDGKRKHCETCEE